MMVAVVHHHLQNRAVPGVHVHTHAYAILAYVRIHAYGHSISLHNIRCYVEILNIRLRTGLSTNQSLSTGSWAHSTCDRIQELTLSLNEVIGLSVGRPRYVLGLSGAVDPAVLLSDLTMKSTRAIQIKIS